jgi:hypothetical protein
MRNDAPWFTGSLISWRPASRNGWLFFAAWFLSFVAGVLLLQGGAYVHLFAVLWIALLFAVRAVKGCK